MRGDLDYEFFKEPPMMDGKYFIFENVKVDLGSFAKENGVKVEDLATTHFGQSRVMCSNGEYTRGQTYIARAGIALGIAQSTLESLKFSKTILLKLKEIAGVEIKEYEVMDEVYFSDSERVKKDLEAYAKAADIKIEDLNSSNIKNIVTCSNGEEVRGETYLCRAGKAFGLAATTEGAQGKLIEILQRLKSAVGIQVKTFETMDNGYFSKSANVKNDLEAYAKAAKVPVENLKRGQIIQKTVMCSNGENVTGNTYVIRGGVALGLAKDKSEAHSKGSEILEELKKIANVNVRKPKIELNSQYFTTESYVKADLETFASEHGIPAAALTTGNFTTHYHIECRNGEKLTGQRYLDTAGKELGLAQTQYEASTKRKEILQKLKEISGIQSMNEKYFSDAKIVRRDLESYARELRITVDELSTSGSKNIKATCTTGESIFLVVYIARAGKELGLASTTTEANHMKRMILDKLKEIAGY